MLTGFQEELETWVPSSTVQPSSKKDPHHAQTQSHARSLRVHLEALDDIRRARDQLVQRARRLADADDIRPRIMREASGIERWTEVEPAMFENSLDAELAKYEKFKDAVEEGAEKQAEVLELIKVRVFALSSIDTFLLTAFVGSVRTVCSVEERRRVCQGPRTCITIIRSRLSQVPRDYPQS